MRIHAITSNNHQGGPNNYQNSWAYGELFHGDAGPSSLYGKRPYQPLMLTRNVHILPAVFIPITSMVVNADIAEKRKRMNGIDLSRCKWGDVYDYPMDEEHIRDLLEHFSPIDDDFHEWIESKKRRPDAKLREDQYFEVIAPPLEALGKEFDCHCEIKLPNPSYMQLERTTTCSALHEKYPLVELTPYYLCADSAYELFAPHVEGKAVFRVNSLEITD